jgi:RNA polymerase sigma factor (sigma-70 family)
MLRTSPAATANRIRIRPAGVSELAGRPLVTEGVFSLGAAVSVAEPTSLTSLFDHLRDGRPGARNAVLAALRDNLTRLTVAILRRFPVVQQRREADSLFQQLCEKLIAALDAGVQPENPTEFIKFAAARLRRMLIDEADKLRRRREVVGLGGADGRPIPPPDVGDSPSVLAQWAEFQEKVGQLSDTELLVFDLHFHMQMPQSEVAELLNMEAKAVSRTWLGATKKLKGLIPTAIEPPAVAIVSGGTAFTTPAAVALFAGWRAVRVRAVGGAETGRPLPAAALEWAEVVCVTRPEYAAAVGRSSAARGKRVVCLDVPDAFDPTAAADVSRLWERLLGRIE